MQFSVWLRALAYVTGSVAFAACVGDEPASSGEPKAATDASVSDAQRPPDDAATEPPADAAALGFCASRPTPGDFCADFDEGNDVAAGWTIAEVRGSSESPAYAELSASPPRSMRVAVHRVDAPDPDASTTDVAISRESFQRPYANPQQQSALVVEFALYIESVGPSNGPISIAAVGLASPLELLLESTTGGSELELSLAANGTKLGVSKKSVKLQTWTRISLRMSARRSADGGEVGAGVTLGVDGVSATIMMPPQPLTDTYRVDIGLGFPNYVGGEWSALYDDVFLDGAD